MWSEPTPRRVFAAAVLILVLLPSLAQAGGGKTEQSSTWLNEKVLVLHPADVKAGDLPRSFQIAGVAQIFDTDIRRACIATTARPNDLLVFLPTSRKCLTLTKLFEQARNSNQAGAVYALMDIERKRWLKTLDTEPYVVVKPKIMLLTGRTPNGVEAALSCSCPQPELIFIDGFESST